MKPRLYFDTSVFGGIYDMEFQEETQKLFEMVLKEEIVCVYSDLIETELKNAPKKVKEHFFSLPKERLETSKEAFELAEQYIKGTSIN